MARDRWRAPFRARRDGAWNGAALRCAVALTRAATDSGWSHPLFMNIRFCLIAAVIVMLSAAPAHAQSQPQPQPQPESQSFLKENIGKLIRKVGVHANVGYRHPIDSKVTKGRSYGVSMGLAPGHTNGWKWPVSLSWYSQDLHAPNGEQFAVMRSIGLLAGIGYGWHFGKFSPGISLQTGYFLNNAQEENLQQAFGIPDGSVSLAMGNSWVLRPQAKLEYFLHPKFTLRVSADYVRSRPDITVSTPTQRFDRQWDSSSWHGNVGIGYYPFRK